MITRRSMLVLAGALVATPAAGYVGARIACRSVPRNVPAFFAHADQDVLREFGQAVVRHTSAYADSAFLEAQVALKPNLVEASLTTCEQTRSDLVGAQCAQDFADGDFEIVDSVMVSRTEMLLCASLVAA
ncbi:MAG: hypothetical protein JJ908_16790 [Rhizobiales bacterium]|nr:hypothetical protein [Hyphomicrobiales bacterium]MBO6700492.1 hypothetical protein [Hyphomicrobiales bacterium]MBO6738028.1 hypothetical protein [Hyphomicrobiales bacterium]MBO6913665.1 hypothetical protein [Hyphomicrobiales bacterium]MBO6954438.1 hypothetical protein [Hyphomicrobiales bacterium]